MKRGVHIPRAVNVEWTKNHNSDGTFKSNGDLIKLYEAAGVTRDREVVVYCLQISGDEPEELYASIC